MFRKILQFLRHRQNIRGRNLSNDFSGRGVDDFEVGDPGRFIHFELKAGVRLLELGIDRLGIDADGFAGWTPALA